MILVITNRRDITSDYIILELKRRNMEYFRFNTEDLPEAQVWFRPEEACWTINLGSNIITSKRVSAAYFRRPGAVSVNSQVKSLPERLYATHEWSEVLRSIYGVLDGKWLNSPTAIFRAENKSLQLSTAYSLGFSIPQTIITNAFHMAAEFANGGHTVAKPLREALLDDDGEERVIFTSRVTEQFSNMPSAAVSAAPIIFQREIFKAFDLRITVVADRVFAVEIHSQHKTETEVDWRKGSHPDTPHKVHALPDEIESACIDLTKKLGLRFGAIDMVLDKAGRYWFLEINPNGQWAWIENRTGLPISAAIVDTLQAIALS
ncbi:hypothetical protein [Muricoccus radiodurans]|uniref:hypothetical protein n=1 Tax=Muricoccus radiodurans TaxID=2231721 RepID=UPI003CE9EAF0